MQCVRMPYACPRKSASEESVDPPVAEKPQLTGHIPSRTPRIRTPYAALIRPREKTPEKLDLRVEAQREPAGDGAVHTQRGAKNQTNLWRGSSINARPSGSRPDEAAGRGVVHMQLHTHTPAQLRPAR